MLPACVRTSSAFVGELHAARLAAPADLHLRLHDDRDSRRARRARDRLVDGLGDVAGRHRNAVAREQLLALVLEQIQRTPRLSAVRNYGVGLALAPIERRLRASR